MTNRCKVRATLQMWSTREIDFTPRLRNLHLNYFIYVYLHKGEYIFMCDDGNMIFMCEEGNSVLIEMLIKILFIIAIFHKQQFKTKGKFKYFTFLANAFKYWVEIGFLFFVQTQVCLFVPSVQDVIEFL